MKYKCKARDETREVKKFGLLEANDTETRLSLSKSADP